MGAWRGREAFRQRRVALIATACVIGALVPVAAGADAAVAIVADPAPQSVSEGATVTLTASATGDPTPTVQWERSPDGSTFAPIDGATSDSYSFTAQLADNGASFRAVFTNTSGSVPTAAAVLTVTAAPTPPVVTLDPVDVTAQFSLSSADAVSFTSTATGHPAPTVQWQVRLPGFTDWSSVGATGQTGTFLVTPNENNLGKHYRALWSNSEGTVASAEAALLLAAGPPVVAASSFASPESVPLGSTRSLIGNVLSAVTPTAVWERSSNGGITWSTHPEPSRTFRTGNHTYGYGSDSSTPPMEQSMNGLMFRPRWTSPHGTTTGLAKTVITPPAANQAFLRGVVPLDQTVRPGVPLVFHASATGTSLAGVAWVKIQNGVSTNLTGYVASTSPTYVTSSVTYTPTAVDVGATIQATFAYGCGLFLPCLFTSAASLTAAPTIDLQPISTFANVGETATFTAHANAGPGETLTAQWQRQRSSTSSFVDIPGATGDTLSFVVAPEDLSASYRVVYTSPVGSITSSQAMLTAPGAPVITLQPADQLVKVPMPASAFFFIATGVTSKSWQRSSDGGVTWVHVASLNSHTPVVDQSMDGWLYRVVLSNASGSTTSRAAVLSVQTLPQVTTQPVAATVVEGLPASFTVSYTDGTAPATVQWFQFPNSSSTSGTAIPGATAATYGLPATTAAMNGTCYRATITSTVGTTNSSKVCLTVQWAPKDVVVTPADASGVLYTNPATAIAFTVAGSANPTATRQWQQSTDNGATWQSIAGATAATYSITGPNVTDALNGRRFRAQLTNTVGATTSNVVTVVVKRAPQVTASPVDATVVSGVDVTLLAAASGSPTPAAQWQRSVDGGSTWVDIAGATDVTLSLPGVTTAQSGTKYRVVFTNLAGSATTAAGTLVVQRRPQTIALDALPASGAPGAVLDVVASASSGLPVSIAATGACTLASERVTLGSAGTCTVVVSQAGDAETEPASDVSAVIDVGEAPVVRLDPADVSIEANGSAAFTAAADGTPSPGVVWELSTDDGASWDAVADSTDPTLSLTSVPIAWNGRRYRAVFTNSGGTARTAAAVLTVSKAAQTISFDPLPASATVGSTLPVAASASSGLTVALTVSGPCSVVPGGVKLTAGGTCSVTATQPGNPTYQAAPSVVRSVVALKAQTITVSTLPSGLGAGASFVVTATASSGLPVVLSVSGTCSMGGTTSGSPVTLDAAGTCTVTASQGGDAVWAAATPVVRSTIVRGAQSVVFAPLPASPVVGQAVYMSASASSGLGVSFTVSGGGCTVVNATLRFQSAGVVCTVAAVQNGNASYLAATPVVQTAVAAPGPQSILIAGLPQNLSPGATFVVTATSTSGLGVVLSASGACTIDGSVSGSTVSITGSGMCSVTASQGGDGNWLAAPTVVRTSVVKAEQSISFPGLPVDPLVGSSRVLGASASSGLGVSYTASGGCTVVNSLLRFTSVSECTVTATQPGNASFLAASPVVRSTVAVRGVQSIGVGSVPVNVAVGGSFVVTALASSGLPVSVVVSGPCSTPDSVVPATVTMTASGTCMVVLTQPGDANYAAAPAVSRSTIAKAAQSITFPDLPVAPMVGTTRTLGATSSSGLGVTYTASGGCTVVNTTLRFTTVSAACTVTATQAGNVMWFAAAPVSRSTTAVPGAQTIQVAALPQNQSVGATFVVSATATSTLPVVLAASGACSIAGSVSGSTVTITGAGTCSVTATQGGNADWLAAPTVVRTSIVRAPQTITFELPVAPVAGTTVTLTGSSSAGLGLTYVASGACTIVNFTRLRFDTAGAACTVTATQPGNTYYLPATPVTRTTTIT